MSQWYLLKNSDGKKSVSYTMLVATFAVLTLWLTLSIFAKIHHLEIREFDAGAATVWFAPIASLYFGRRWQISGDTASLLKKKEEEVVKNTESNGESGTPA